MSCYVIRTRVSRAPTGGRERKNATSCKVRRAREGGTATLFRRRTTKRYAESHGASSSSADWCEGARKSKELQVSPGERRRQSNANPTTSDEAARRKELSFQRDTTSDVLPSLQSHPMVKHCFCYGEVFTKGRSICHKKTSDSPLDVRELLPNFTAPENSPTT